MAGQEDSERRRQAYRERNRLLKLVKTSSPERAQVLRPLCENVGWMKARLDMAREEIGEAELTIEYQHGGGQSGVTENPVFRAYEALFRSYISGLGKLLDALPPAAAAAAAAKEPKKTQLALIYERRKQAG